MRRFWVIGLAACMMSTGVALAKKNKNAYTPVQRFAKAQAQGKQGRSYLQDLHAWVGVSCRTEDLDDKQDCLHEYAVINRHAGEMIEEIHANVNEMRHDLDIMLKAKCEELSASCSKKALQAYDRLKRRAQIVKLNYRFLQDYHTDANDIRRRLGNGRYGGSYDNVADIVKNLRFLHAHIKNDYRTDVPPLVKALDKVIEEAEKASEAE